MNIILDSRKLMAYEDLKYLCEFTGKPQELADSIWQGLLQYPELYDEFLYYLDNRALKDKFTFKGYSLTDIYVYRLTEHNLFFRYRQKYCCLQQGCYDIGDLRGNACFNSLSR